MDGGATAPWVAAGFHTWHGLALASLLRCKVCECRNRRTFQHQNDVTQFVSAETSQPKLLETCWCTCFLFVQHRDHDAAQVTQIFLRLCGVGSTRLNSPMQMQSLIVLSHAVASINMILYLHAILRGAVSCSGSWFPLFRLRKCHQMPIYMATCWNCLLHLLNLGKASSFLLAAFAPWSNAAFAAWQTLIHRRSILRRQSGSSCHARQPLASGAAERLRSAWFRTNDPDLNNAVLVSIDDWVDAGSKELYIYNRVHAHGPPDMDRCRFWGHLPLSWMHQSMIGVTLYYILFYNEEEETMRIDYGFGAEGYSAAAATSMDVISCGNSPSRLSVALKCCQVNRETPSVFGSLNAVLSKRARRNSLHLRRILCWTPSGVPTSYEHVGASNS